MEESQKRAKAVVINSNILFSSLIKEEGFTRAVLLFLKDATGLKFLVPKTVIKELRLNIGEIAEKSKLETNDILAGFGRLLEGMQQIDELELKEEIMEGMKYVNNESDTPFVAVALKHRPAYILTYNKRDYNVGELRKMDVLVVSPGEALDLVGSQ